MIAKNCTAQDLYKALVMVNREYDDNVCFNRQPEAIGKRIRFTLRVVSSRGMGARYGQCLTTKGNRRHLTSACWHVHGHFFERLFEIVPDAEIVANGKSITRSYGNWEDRNIGSIMYPLYYSEACDCEG